MGKHWPYSPGDTIKSANDNDDKEGLATGQNDYDNNSIFVLRREAFDTFFGKNGCIWTQSSGRIGQMSSGSIFASSTGDRTSVSAVASYTFPATQDHYVFINEQTGVLRYVSQTIGNAAPNPNANEVLNAVLTTNASNIIKVQQYGWANNNMPIYNRLAVIPSGAAMNRSIVSNSSITPVTTNNNFYAVTALAAAATINAPAGNPQDGQGLLLRIEDNGTARALTWNGIYRAIGITIPTTTVAGKQLYVSMRYNAVDTKWDVLSVGREA